MHWLVPLLYVLLVLTLACWVGMRVANPSRRGRALFIFSVGIALIVAASAFFLIRAVGSTELVGVGTAATLLMCAMAIVAAGSLLPTVEDWFGARRELRLIAPLRRELGRRHPDIGIGVRPRGPLVFRVAEQLSLISDSLYLEASAAQPAAAGGVSDPPSGMTPTDRALAIARGVHAGRGGGPASSPGRGWLRQPTNYSDREWILEIARQYRTLVRSG
jgi:4-amino-4-deoxy-L-arabinose transferase-like glycosyltransferase